LDWPILKCPQAAVFNRPMTWINECGHITRPSLAESYCGRRDPGSFPAPCPDHCHYRAQLPAQRPHHHCRKRGQNQEDQIQAQRTFDRRTGELNGSLSGSARFTLLLALMENARFSPRIRHADRMVISMLSEPTAVGVFRSAVVVHVASRRWLNFFR